jgi:heat shock protein HtpX
MIERLCVQADLPKPRIAIANTPVPNAFAIGRSPRSATVCATTRIMGLLKPHELEGVMAHELAHVKHRDVLIMTVASFFAGVAAMVVQSGLLFGIGGRDREHDRPLAWVLAAACVVLSFLVDVWGFGIAAFLLVVAAIVAESNRRRDGDPVS